MAADFQTIRSSPDATYDGAPHRLKDLADVQELIRIKKLGLDLSRRLDGSVRDKYVELWHAAATAPEDED